jgi:hypothetical protein
MIDPPKTIFIIPLKDRPTHKIKFINYFNNLLKENDTLNIHNTKLFFINQNDNRLFNRGAIKNIGFIIVKKLYPETYKSINLIYHDVDTIPKDFKLFDYKTFKNSIKHYYGFTYTLGGIFAITAGDFELTKGFSNFWGWGYEDNVLLNRAIKHNININREVLLSPLDNKIIRFTDENSDTITNNKIVSQREIAMYVFKEKLDDLYDITNLNYTENILNNINIFQYDINEFNTSRMYTQSEIKVVNVSKTTISKLSRGWFRRNWNMRSLMSNKH